MIERESTGDGWQVRFVPTPAQRLVRLVPAAFLCVWLCGWAMGEYFAGGALLGLVAERWAPGLHVAGMPRFSGPTGDMALPVMGFLAVWLVGWTLGGCLAIGSVLALLLGVPVLRWDATGIGLDTHVGPFVSRKRLTLEQAETLVRGVTTSPAARKARVLALAGPLVEEADRETLLGWLRDAGAAAGNGATEQMRAIG
jgi:hypothetical protein